MARNAQTMGCGKIERFENDVSWISLKSQMARRSLWMIAWGVEFNGLVDWSACCRHKMAWKWPISWLRGFD